MESTRGGGRQAVVLAITVVCGVVGGLLAIQFWTVDLWPRLLILFSGTAVGVTIAFRLLTTVRSQNREILVGPTKGGSARWRPEPTGVATSHAGPTNPSAAPNRPRGAPSHVALPLPGKPADTRQWWTESSTNSKPDRTANPSGQIPLPSYESDRPLIAQCPRCGDFLLDVTRAGPDYSFRCRNPRCGNQWSWTPGTAWPAVVVRRNLTRG